MKKRISIICIILVLALILSACGEIKGLQDNKKNKNNIEKKETVNIKKDELQIPLTRINTLDPLENSNYSYYNFSKLIYQSLFELDRNLKPSPLLVEDYNIKEDGKTLEILLKEDIYWHNGDKLTTSDVDFTIEKLKDLNDKSIYGNILASAFGNFSTYNIKNVISTQIIDETSMEIYFDKSYGNVLGALTFPIVNRDSYISENLYEPIGTGAYIYKDYNSYKGISLVENEKYWDGKVNISKVNGKIYESQEAIIKAFEDGRVDFAYITDMNLGKYEKDPNIKILEYISPEYEFMGYNFQNQLLSGDVGKEIRKAIYYGIDRQEIIGEVYGGHATQVDTPIYPDSYLTEDVRNIYGYSTIKSKEILEGIGFKDLGSDGVLVDDKGRKLSFTMVTNYSNSYRNKTAEIIKKNLEEIGIEILLKYPYRDIEISNKKSLDMEWVKLNEILKSGDYDLSLLGWDISELTDLSFMFHSSFITSGSNIISYNDKAMDSLLEEVYFDNTGDREGKYLDLQENIMENLPYGSLFFRNRALLVRRNIGGEFNPTFFNLYRGVENYKLLEDKQ